MKKGKNNTWNYVFALTAFALAGLLAFYPSSNESSNKNNLTKNDFSKTDTKIESEQESKKTIVAIVESEVKSPGTLLSDELALNNKSLDLDEQLIDVVASKELEDEVFVNKIVISKNVDTDQESVTYREFIKDEYQTITTTVPGVIKDINYYPSFFVWTSVNTENVNLKNEDDQIEPINLSLVISSDEQELKRVDYNVTSTTPRWRQWAEIDLSLLEKEIVEGTWEVQIINNKNQKVLESRNFKLITPEINKQEETAELKKTF